ncbi:MAG: PH domain-containing protein [archaeon]
MHQLHPGTKWQFRIGGYFSSIIFVFIIAYLVIFPLGLIFTSGSAGSIGTYVAIVLIGMLVLIIIFGEIYAQLSYSNWKYEFTDRELKLERGIIWKRYSNIPYERVQNVDITRGIIARIFGFSTVNIQTAGYSGYQRGGRALSEGHIPGVDVQMAEKIREFVMHKISSRKSGHASGL